MAIEVFSRYEKKFLLKEEQYNNICEKMEGKIKADKNSNEEGYTICNIYYDTFSDDLIAASVDKPVYKEKLRLRSYGVPGLKDKVFLEIKKKYNGEVTKRRIVLTLEEAYNFLEKGERPASQINEQIYRELCYFTQTEYELVPKIFLSYERKAFFGAQDPDLRITFDSNILSRKYDLRLEKGNYGDPILDEKVWLMEIKASNAIPMWLTSILSENEIYSRSFSKYGTVYEKNNNQNVFLEGESKCLNQYLEQRQKQGLQFNLQ